MTAETEFKIVKTNKQCCANCKGINTGGFAWVYCEVRKDNDEKFDGDCGETLGCNRFISAVLTTNTELYTENSKDEMRDDLDFVYNHQKRELVEVLTYARKNLIECGFAKNSMQIIKIDKLLNQK